MRVTIDEAIEMTGRSFWSFRKYVQSGALTVHSKPGTFRSWVVDVGELLDLLERNRDAYLNRPKTIPRGPDKRPRKRRGTA